MNIVEEKNIIEEFLEKVEKHKKPSYVYLPKNSINESFEDVHKRLENLEHNKQMKNALLDKNHKGKDKIIINPPQNYRIKEEKGKRKIPEIKQYMITKVKELEQTFLESSGEVYEEYKKQLRELTEKNRKYKNEY